MVEPQAGRGQALRFYHIMLLLGVGWGLGRVPDILTASDREQHHLADSLGLVAHAETSDLQGQGSVARERRQEISALDMQLIQMTADVAARVATQVADDTIRRLIEAGWSPHAQQTGTPGAGPSVHVVRVPVPQYITAHAPKEATSGSATHWTLLLPSSDKAEPIAKTQKQVVATPPGAEPDVPRGTARTDVSNSRAYALATKAYEELRRGQRKEAALLLKQAVALDSEGPNSRQWETDYRALSKRWSVAGYSLSREGGVNDALAASPVLGGKQSGAALGYMLNPYDEARVSLIARTAVASAQNGSMDSRTAEAAIGVRVQPSRSIPVALDVERRIALGEYSRHAWAARLSGGKVGTAQMLALPLAWEGYGEAGVIGFDKAPAWYAGGQMRAGTPLLSLGRIEVDGGAGAWAAIQRDYGLTASRVDIGPSAKFRIQPWGFTAQMDYRVQAAGNAQPGSGPVLTVAGEF